MIGRLYFMIGDGVVTVDGQIVFSLDSGYVRDNV